MDDRGFGSLVYLVFNVRIHPITRPGVRKSDAIQTMACSCLWKGSMAGADGEDTFMKNSADTDVARLCYNNFPRWGNIDLNPLSLWPSLLPASLELPSESFYSLPPIIHETSWAKLSLFRGALMKPTSLSERVWKNNGGTEIITLHSASEFNTFFIRVILAGWITGAIS